MICPLETCRRSRACTGPDGVEPCFQIPGVRERVQQDLRQIVLEVEARRAAGRLPPALPAEGADRTGGGR